MSTQLKMDLVKGNAQRKKLRLLGPIAVVAALSLSALAWPSVKATRTTPANDRAAQGTLASQPAAESTAATSGQTNDLIATTLSPTGFSPTGLSHAAGRFNLRVNNKSRQQKISLRLSKSDGEKLTEVQLTDKVRGWTEPVELAPGNYTLTEANHPDWACNIEVTAQ
jgi:hypothetical protein